jgi:tryptophanyl-tRNA synthetase
MYTDPNHLRASDPGRVQGNVVFTYLDAFDEDREEVADLKARYTKGGLGDSAVKQRLERVLKQLVGPIRDRRAAVASDPDTIMDILRDGTKAAQIVTDQTYEEIRNGLNLFEIS